MRKKIVVISSSLRRKSNSDALAEAFVQGAAEAGHEVEKIMLKGKDIRYCTGCLTCHKTLRCVLRDDADAVVEKIQQSDIVVFATPVYFYGMSGLLKTLLDRTNPLYTAENRFREVYLLASAAEDEEDTVEGTIRGIQGWIDCFRDVRLCGTIFAGGVNAPGATEGHPALEKACGAGKRI